MHRAKHRRRHAAQQGMRTAGVAALLPALFLSALYVAAPFAGTTTHAISRTAPALAVPAHSAVDAPAYPRWRAA